MTFEIEAMDPDARQHFALAIEDSITGTEVDPKLKAIGRKLIVELIGHEVSIGHDAIDSPDRRWHVVCTCDGDVLRFVATEDEAASIAEEHKRMADAA